MAPHPAGSWLSASLTTCCLLVAASPGMAQQAPADRHAEDRISVDHARPVSNRPSTTERSRGGKVSAGRDRGEAQIGGAPDLQSPAILPVGFLEDVGQLGHDCGPVCDCDAFHGGPAAPGSGSGYINEPAGGIDWGESPHGYEPICGSEASCGLETCAQCRGGSARGVDGVPLFLPILRVDWSRFDLFAGVQGYTGPMNSVAAEGQEDPIRSGSGSFGFYQGFNQGRSLRHWLGLDLAAQIGVRTTQSNLSGSEFTDDTRQQVFLTGGFFRRVDRGLQYGLVVDYLNEDWYHQADVTQLRGELSWRTRRCDEFGFQFMTGLGGERSTTFFQDPDGLRSISSAFIESTNHYRFFYRWRLPGEGAWSAFGGWSEADQGVLGTQIDLPLVKQVALQTGFAYFAPDDALGSEEHRSEAWNVSLGLVFRPGGPRRGTQRYSTPLLPVADNGTFVLRRR